MENVLVVDNSTINRYLIKKNYYNSKLYESEFGFSKYILVDLKLKKARNLCDFEWIYSGHPKITSTFEFIKLLNIQY